MRKNKTLCILLATILSIFGSANAAPNQTLAKSYEGQEVILNPSGTWEYVSNRTAREIPTGSALFKSKIIPYGVYYDPSIWKPCENDNEDVEISFETVKGNGLFAEIIVEDVGYSLQAIRENLIEGLRDNVKELEVIKEENRVVNGIKVKYVEMRGKSHNQVDLHYMAYIYDGETESIQFLSTELGKSKYNRESDMEKLLNGLTRLD